MVITKISVDLLSKTKSSFVFIFILFFVSACSEKLVPIPSENENYTQEDNSDIIEDPINQGMDTCFVDTTFNDTTNFALSKNGTVYFQCDFGPYDFTIDSLLTNGNFAGNLKDTAFHLQSGIQPNIVFGKHYDYEKEILQNLNALDFTVTRTGTSYQYFESSTNFSYDTILPVDYIFGNDTLIENEYPYYNGVLIKTNLFDLELLFFNKYVGGCYHDEMVWFYYD